MRMVVGFSQNEREFRHSKRRRLLPDFDAAKRLWRRVEKRKELEKQVLTDGEQQVANNTGGYRRGESSILV